MNNVELDDYLRTFSGHEYSDLEQIKIEYNFDSIEETLQNLHLVTYNDYPDRVRTNIISGLPTDLFFKKHARFIPISPHKHNHIEMAYIYSGEIKEVINGNLVTLKKGDLIILDTNVIHSIEMAGLDDIMLNFAMSKEYFNNSFFNELSSNNIITNFILNSIYEKQKFNAYLAFHTSDNDNIHHIICKLASEFISPDIGSDVLKDNYIKILFTELIRLYNTQGENEASFNKQTQISFEILNYIKDNYASTTLSEAAKHFNFNPNYFSTYVKKITGISFKDLVLQEKLNKASYLLRSTSIPIESICEEVGIGNINFFYKKFKERYGATPKKYRD